MFVISRKFIFGIVRILDKSMEFFITEQFVFAYSPIRFIIQSHYDQLLILLAPLSVVVMFVVYVLDYHDKLNDQQA